MSFKDKPFEERHNDSMFDLSERRFELLWDGPYFKYGLGQEASKLNSFKLGAFISHTPDYVAAFTETSQPLLIEVQGTGGQPPYQHRFKKRKLDALGRWDKENPVAFWLWFDPDQTYHLVSYKAIRMATLQGKATEGTFDGFRPYWAIDMETMDAIEDSAALRKQFS